jgi:hypothetical protein
MSIQDAKAQLREDLGKALDELVDGLTDAMTKTVAEQAKLRAALTRIRDHRSCDPADAFQWAQLVARNALGETE